MGKPYLFGQTKSFWDRLQKMAAQRDKNEIASQAIKLCEDVMYLNGCVKRGRGEDIDAVYPSNNIFRYILELERKLEYANSVIEQRNNELSDRWNETKGDNHIAKYVKKPIPIEATQWNKDGDHANVKRVYIPQDLDPLACEKCGQPARLHGTIITLEGKGGAQEVCPGDWIITGIQGENYPCKPDIFAATYDQVAE